jgi:hypothetical protein
MARYLKVGTLTKDYLDEVLFYSDAAANKVKVSLIDFRFNFEQNYYAISTKKQSGIECESDR